ncbi:tail fiber protein / tail tubular protein A [Enterobacter phage 01_vB_Eclo_IJM]|nr:tail fiber protein / tail tubular protein A [Enterobacter phage 01_vB_Eclo_IJM]
MENFIVVNSAGAYNRMYIYKFPFRDGVQLQASWSHWEFEPERRSSRLRLSALPSSSLSRVLRELTLSTSGSLKRLPIWTTSRIVCIWTPRPQCTSSRIPTTRTPSLHWWTSGGLWWFSSSKGNYFMVDDQGAYVSGAAGRSKSVNIRVTGRTKLRSSAGLTTCATSFSVPYQV